jgi:hypothetical protein
MLCTHPLQLPYTPILPAPSSPCQPLAGEGQPGPTTLKVHGMLTSIGVSSFWISSKIGTYGPVKIHRPN